MKKLQGYNDERNRHREEERKLKEKIEASKDKLREEQARKDSDLEQMMKNVESERKEIERQYQLRQDEMEKRLRTEALKRDELMQANMGDLAEISQQNSESMKKEKEESVKHLLRIWPAG